MQARGQETFERILAITGQLLDEVGADALTTNLIAQAAGVNVATLYQYFPNKHAILVRLFQQHAGRRTAVVKKAFAESAKRGGDWRDGINAAIDAVHRIGREVPGVLPLSQAMRSDPALIQYDREEATAITRWLSAELARAASVPREEADLVARCAIEAVRSLLDLSQLDKSFKSERVLQQARDLAGRYLQPYFAAPRARRSPPARKRR
jgi:AcrR family transcriptional regulator